MSFISRTEPGNPDPTLLVLHGTGGDENSLVPLAQSLWPGQAILSLRGRIDENGMPRFFRRFAEGVFDYDNIREEADALAEFLAGPDSLVSLPASPTGKVHYVGFGYSNGANMAWSTVLRHPEAMPGAVLLRPMMTLDEQADLTGKKFFVSAGRYDPIVPLPTAEALLRRMEECGAAVTVNWVEGGHQLTREELTLAGEWLRATFG